MARITQEQYWIKDLELKADIAKSLRIISAVVAYKSGPSDIDLMNKTTEVIYDGFKINGHQKCNETEEAQS